MNNLSTKLDKLTNINFILFFTYSFLKEILGGNCRTFMLATFSQSNWITPDDLADSLKYPK